MDIPDQVRCCEPSGPSDVGHRVLRPSSLFWVQVSIETAMSPRKYSLIAVYVNRGLPYFS